MAEKIAEYMMQPADQVSTAWFVSPPAGTSRNAPLDAAFWVHVARKLRPMARVTVMPEDGAWYQELLCVVADGRDIRMKELNFWELEDTSDVNFKSDTGEMRIEWAGPKHLWRVVRNSDNMVLAKGLPTRGDANSWISVNTRRSAA